MNFNKDPRVCLCPSVSCLSPHAYHIAAVLLSDKLNASSLLKRKEKQKKRKERRRRRKIWPCSSTHPLYLTSPAYLRRVFPLPPPPRPIPSPSLSLPSPRKLKFTGVLQIYTGEYQPVRGAEPFSNSFFFLFLFSVHRNRYAFRDRSSRSEVFQRWR